MRAATPARAAAPEVTREVAPLGDPVTAGGGRLLSLGEGEEPGGVDSEVDEGEEDPDEDEDEVVVPLLIPHSVELNTPVMLAMVNISEYATAGSPFVVLT